VWAERPIHPPKADCVGVREESAFSWRGRQLRGRPGWHSGPGPRTCGRRSCPGSAQVAADLDGLAGWRRDRRVGAEVIEQVAARVQGLRPGPGGHASAGSGGVVAARLQQPVPGRALDLFGQDQALVHQGSQMVKYLPFPGVTGRGDRLGGRQGPASGEALPVHHGALREQLHRLESGQPGMASASLAAAPSTCSALSRTTSRCRSPTASTRC
jgi:hypothetical protein